MSKIGYVCRFYVNDKFKLSCHSKLYDEIYSKLCNEYGEKNIRVEKTMIGREFDSKLNAIIKQIREWNK